MENKRQKVEIGDIFRRFGSEYNEQHEMIHEQQKAFNAIMNCRSQELDGHTLKCDNCGNVQHAYNSCRNRHCPKCQYLKQVVWVDKLKARLLPVMCCNPSYMGTGTDISSSCSSFGTGWRF